MTTSFQFGLANGGFDNYNGTAGAVANQITIAAQTTQAAATTVIQSGVVLAVPIAGSTALNLPMNEPLGGPIVVTNGAATAVSLTVFPPWNANATTLSNGVYTAAPVASGGKIFGWQAALPTANAGVVVAQGRTVVFYPHANGIDYTAVWSAVA